MAEPTLKTIDTDDLRIGYLEYGDPGGWPVVLSHGFPYDVHAFSEVAETLRALGARVITPYARGFGPTRFLPSATSRSGQQAARGRDVLQLADALDLKEPILGGFDWGGNASCVAAALWPERFAGLVSYAGYDVLNVADQSEPSSPALERVCWYQHLFQSERGRRCLTNSRYDLSRLLWEEWSPNWNFNEVTFTRSAEAFNNPDFVDVVISCYRHMSGHEAGDPLLLALENRLAKRPPIEIPSITLDGIDDPLKPGGTLSHNRMFRGLHEHRVVRSGHNLPQEAPDFFAAAIDTVHRWTSSL